MLNVDIVQSQGNVINVKKQIKNKDVKHRYEINKGKQTMISRVPKDYYDYWGGEVLGLRNSVTSP